MHMSNCEMITNHVKNRNLPCSIYYNVIGEGRTGYELLTNSNYGGGHYYPTTNGNILP